MQIPFLTSDPDVNISGSRGANTDEGLYTCQIRNLINHNDFTFNKSDGFIKTPLFGAIMFLPIKIFGSSLLTGRLVILIVSLLICLIIFSKNKYWMSFGLTSIVIVYSEYYIFHFFHFCLAEILSTVLIFLSLFVLVESRNKQHPIQSSFSSAIIISLAYFLKIQYLYAVLILLMSITLFLIVDKQRRKQWTKQLFYTFLFIILFISFYYVFWYLPNKKLFDYIMEDQTSNKFSDISNLFSQLKFNLNYIFYNNYLKYFTFSFYLFFIIGVIYLFKTSTTPFRFLFIVFTFWVLIELHKLPMSYLPTRYLISLYFPMGLIIALVLLETFMLNAKVKYSYLLKVVPILVLVFFAISNGLNYSSSYKNKSFTIKEINNYLLKYDFGNKPILGAWAPSLSLQSKAISYPIWKDYFNDKSVIEKYSPAIIIAEIDEEDSNQAFISQGIHIDNYADSIKYFSINRWKIKLLWMKQSTHTTFKK